VEARQRSRRAELFTSTIRLDRLRTIGLTGWRRALPGLPAARQRCDFKGLGRPSGRDNFLAVTRPASLSARSASSASPDGRRSRPPSRALCPKAKPPLDLLERASHHSRTPELAAKESTFVFQIPNRQVRRSRYAVRSGRYHAAAPRACSRENGGRQRGQFEDERELGELHQTRGEIAVGGTNGTKAPALETFSTTLRSRGGPSRRRGRNAWRRIRRGAVGEPAALWSHECWRGANSPILAG